MHFPFGHEGPTEYTVFQPGYALAHDVEMLSFLRAGRRDPRLANLSVGPDTSGYSVIELAVVIVVAGLLALIATPTLARSWDVERVRSAMATVTAIHAKARGVAIQRSSPVSLVIEDGTVLIRAIHPVLDVVDTVGAVVDLHDYYGVALVSTRDSLLFDARGIGKESSSTYLILSRNDAIDTLRVSQSGRFYP